MQANAPTLVGVFSSREDAEMAIDDLHEAGFDHRHVGFAIRGVEPGGMLTDSALVKDTQGATRGAITGGLAGGALGALAALTMPGVGPVMAAGILATALGFGAAGVAVGGILGAMAGLGISEEEAKLYEREFHAGRAIVVVQADDRLPEARRILQRHGAIDLHVESRDPL